MAQDSNAVDSGLHEPSFNDALYATLWFETGGRFDPNDPGCIHGTDRLKCGTSGGVNDHGGNTKYGISKASHPNVDIDALDLNGAAKIWFDEYWVSVGAQQLPGNVVAYLFDFAGTSGTNTARKILQRAVGVVADGVFGAATHAAVAKADIKLVLASLKDQRRAYYQAIADHNPSQTEFLNGWDVRADTYLYQLTRLKGVYNHGS